MTESVKRYYVTIKGPAIETAGREIYTNVPVVLATDYEALERERDILQVKCKNSFANNLCPDHRDKQTFKPCLACTIETLTRERDRLQHDRDYAYQRLHETLEQFEGALKNASDQAHNAAIEEAAKLFSAEEPMGRFFQERIRALKRPTNTEGKL